MKDMEVTCKWWIVAEVLGLPERSCSRADANYIRKFEVKHGEFTKENFLMYFDAEEFLTHFGADNFTSWEIARGY